MRKSIINTPVRRRVAITTAGIAAAAALAVPGVAWATGSPSETAPVVVSAPVENVAPAAQSGTSNGECARDLSQEEVDALVAKGEINPADITPASALEPAVAASAEEIRANEAAGGADTSAMPAEPAC